MTEQQQEMASQSSTAEAPAGKGKEGIVYLLTNPSMEGYVKGISKNASWIVIDGESGNSLACR